MENVTARYFYEEGAPEKSFHGRASQLAIFLSYSANISDERSIAHFPRGSPSLCIVFIHLVPLMTAEEINCTLISAAHSILICVCARLNAEQIIFFWFCAVHTLN